MVADEFEEQPQEEQETPDTRPELTVLVLLRDQLQKLRIAETNRIASAQKLGEFDRVAVHERYAKELTRLEQEITADVAREVRNHPAWEWLKDIHGVAETSAALVLGYIDISRANTISALWRYAGYGVDAETGKRERPVKGKKLTYNARLKTMVWRLIDLQVKLRGPYRKIYDDAKHTYTTTRMSEPHNWTKGHVEAAARRKAAKMFLSHLWMVWREAAELETRSPWIAEHGQPQHTIIGPREFIDAFNADAERVKAAKKKQKELEKMSQIKEE